MVNYLVIKNKNYDKEIIKQHEKQNKQKTSNDSVWSKPKMTE